MAHPEQLAFVDAVHGIFPRHFQGARVLEIGSLDINGTIRNRFSGCQYTGLDVAAGPGVDVVCQGQDYDAPSGSFDTVISCEVMEHNPAWRETFRNMVRLCRPDGLVIMTCAAMGREVHGTSEAHPATSPLTVAKGQDYYRNLMKGDFLAEGLMAGLGEWRFFRNTRSYDLYFVGVPDRFSDEERSGLAGLARQLARNNFLTSKGVRRFFKAHLWYRR